MVKRILLAIAFLQLSVILRAETMHFESVAEMAKSIQLREGDVAITKGFYSAGDGGGATYNILASPKNIAKYPADGWSIINLLTEGLYADILINDEVSICQLGALPVISLGSNPEETRQRPHYRDCHDNLMAYLNLCRRRNRVYQLTCPAGHFFTSPAFLVIGNDKGVRIRGAAPKDYGHRSTTTFHAMTDRQEYIWTISGAEHICHKDYPFIQTSGVNITNISFSGQYSGSNNSKNQVSPIAALIAVGMCNSNFESLNFAYIGGSAMVLCNVQETVFGFVSLGACGAFYKGRVMPCVWYAQMMGKEGFARRILGRTDADYAPFKSSRNCSANYYDYIDAEGIGGSIIHADKGAVFTHSEIGNIQWEGSFCDFANMRNHGYDYLKANGKEDFSKMDNIHADTHPREKTIRCGAFSGWGRDITIHAITHTWNPMGYAAWYGDTMYRVRKEAAIIFPYDETDKYSNIHLIDYNWRQPFPACYIESPQGAPMHPRAFTLDTPILPNTNIIRCEDGSATPCLNFAGMMPTNVIYPALTRGTYMSCHYNAKAIAPAHLVAYSSQKNGLFPLTYQATRHYLARVATHTPLSKKYVNVHVIYQDHRREKSALLKCPILKKSEDFCTIDFCLDQLDIDDNTTVKVTMGSIEGASPLEWDCIYLLDNTPIYAAKAPVSDSNWIGRLWYNTQEGQLYRCSQLKEEEDCEDFWIPLSGTK